MRPIRYAHASVVAVATAAGFGLSAGGCGVFPLNDCTALAMCAPADASLTLVDGAAGGTTSSNRGSDASGSGSSASG